MEKRYSFAQLEQFAKAYSLNSQELLHDPQTNFYKSIKQAILEVYHFLYERCNGRIDVIFNKRHSWISCDLETNEMIYDTKTRDDEWSRTLIDLILDMYCNYEEIKEFEESKTDDSFINLYDVLKTYYEQKGYFYNIFNIGLSRLTFADWQRVSDNEYAKKVIKAYKSEPLYQIGELVSLRENREYTSKREGDNAPRFIPKEIDTVMILSNTEPILNARKGAKRYKVVPVGNTWKPIWIEEAFMKKLKRKVNKQ